MRPLRIAFLTSEFQREGVVMGGLGAYVHRMAQALLQEGHEPEVFTWRRNVNIPRVELWKGVRIEYVDVVRNRWLDLLARFDRRFLHAPWDGIAAYLGGAIALARALERRHGEHPFNLVQSTNCGASGLCVRHRPGRRHIARSSSVRKLCLDVDEMLTTPGAHLISWLEWRSVRRAELMYAPSQCIAEYYRRETSCQMAVVRPPVFLDCEPAKSLTLSLPPRYMVHFGSIGAVKGSHVLAKALTMAWERAPDLTMIWAGRERYPGAFKRCQGLWGTHASQVEWVGPLSKAVLYAVVRRAVASVAPSLVDNLPNTVMESLWLGVPVIGSDGASIDELVTPGVNGFLSPVGDASALADNLVGFWRGEMNLPPGPLRLSDIFLELTPKAAVSSFLRFAKPEQRPAA